MTDPVKPRKFTRENMARTSSNRVWYPAPDAPSNNLAEENTGLPPGTRVLVNGHLAMVVGPDGVLHRDTYAEHPTGANPSQTIRGLPSRVDNGVRDTGRAPATTGVGHVVSETVDVLEQARRTGARYFPNSNPGVQIPMGFPLRFIDLLATRMSGGTDPLVASTPTPGSAPRSVPVPAAVQNAPVTPSPEVQARLTELERRAAALRTR